jgi:biofilm PGA synthesis N-glycosyltransferase PgaC
VSNRYVLISPCRDESDYMTRTLESVMAQTVPPALWVVVDDGSTDETPAILERYRARIPSLRVIRRTNRGSRSVGPGVIETFYTGLDSINLDDFDYLCKLDLDLDLPPRYFELLIRRMEENTRLGTTSGKPYFSAPGNDKMIPEVCGDEMSVGMTKFYRVQCFRDIGGFVRQVMWDGIDCHRCRMLGWIAESVDDVPLRFNHLRPMGSSQKGIWTGRIRFGYGQYFMGSAPLYFLMSAVFRLTKHPAILGSVASVWGFFSSALRGVPQYDDLAFRKFLRKYQYACLRMGKRRATLLTNQRQESIWRARARALQIHS